MLVELFYRRAASCLRGAFIQQAGLLLNLAPYLGGFLSRGSYSALGNLVIYGMWFENEFPSKPR